MDIRTHIYASTLLGGSLYAFTKSPQVAFSAFLSGIFIDIDHLFDYLAFSKEGFSLKKLFLWCDNGKWEKITLAFHSYELYCILGVTGFYFPNTILTGILSGAALHLILDQTGNRYINKKFCLSLFFYFLTYRAYHGFHKSRLRIDKLTECKDSLVPEGGV